MSYKTKEDVMRRVQEHHVIAVEKYGDRVLGTFLQGSWNYGWDLCDEESDVDTKCIVLPTFEDFCLGKKPVSTTHVLENGEHLDAKDLRLYMDCFKKQNVNFVEILFTDFKVVNPKYEEQWNRLVDAREQIGRYDMKRALSCIVGMAFEKNKALCHPYPTLKDKIEKYGYDGKQVSHIMRLHAFMTLYMSGESYADCLKCKGDTQFLEHCRQVKRHEFGDLKWAKAFSETTCSLLKERKDEWLEENPNYEYDKEIEKLMNDVCIECMKINFLDFIKNNA